MSSYHKFPWLVYLIFTNNIIANKFSVTVCKIDDRHSPRSDAYIDDLTNQQSDGPTDKWSAKRWLHNHPEIWTEGRCNRKPAMIHRSHVIQTLSVVIAIAWLSWSWHDLLSHISQIQTHPRDTNRNCLQQLKLLQHHRLPFFIGDTNVFSVLFFLLLQLLPMHC